MPPAPFALILVALASGIAAGLAAGSALPGLAAAVVSVAGGWFAGRAGAGPDRKVVTKAMAKRGEPSAESVLAGLSLPAVLFDRRGMVVHANAVARETFPGLVQGVALARLFREPAVQDLIAGLAAGSDGGDATWTERRPDERIMAARGRQLGDGSGLALVTFHDQSEARRIERMRADFVANASHELRTPLAAISGFLETLQGKARDNPEARDRFIAIMLEQTARMSRLIDDLLSLSRLEGRAADFQARPVDLGALARDVAVGLESVAARNGVAVTVNLAPGTATARGDADELRQVIQNLIENACKYGASGGRVEVNPARALHGGETGLAVRDFGPGIEQEHIPRLTERFYRVDVKSSRDKQGTGLGLSIVRHIVLRHRGRLVIESAPGEGATFTLALPKWQPHVEA